MYYFDIGDTVKIKSYNTTAIINNYKESIRCPGTKFSESYVESYSAIIFEEWEGVYDVLSEIDEYDLEESKMLLTERKNLYLK